VLNLHWFKTLDEAKVIIEAWRRNLWMKEAWVNESHRHLTLIDLLPVELKQRTGSGFRTGLTNVES
jgi:putative transposase